MKHLLTALIAMLFLVLPLRADEPTNTISVRVIDHEDKPISGLSLYAKVGSARAESVTDPSGLASFTVQAPPDADSVWIWTFDSSFVLPRHNGADAAFNSYAWNRVYQFDLDAFEDKPATIRVPRSVQCEVRLHVSAISPAFPLNYGLQRRGGPHCSWSRSGKGSYWGSSSEGPYIGSSLPIERAQPVHIAVFAQGRLHVVELDAEQTARSVVIVDIENIDGKSTDRFGFTDFSESPRGKVFCRFDDDAKAIRFCLIAVDGDHAREVSLTRARARTESGGETYLRHATTMVPSGEYFIYPMNRSGMYWERDAFGANFWTPGSVFDTLLRLRRGEDLPHLKRITIPEGGTVELSTEDFLDPPAANPKDTTP